MMPTPAAIPGIDALWPLCLDIVEHRRGRLARLPWKADAPLASDTLHGYSLRGMWDDAAIELFELVKPLLDRPRNGAPWAIGQLGQSLDGYVATHNGDSHYVNGPQVLIHLHRLRALCDAVIVGAGTAAIDDPQLTTRHVPGRDPVRVLIDPALQLSPALRALSDRQAPTLLACDASRAAEARGRFGADQVLAVPAMVDVEGRLNLRALLSELSSRDLRVLFVEGGGVTVSRFMAQGCLDRLHLSIAPVIIGSGRPGLQLPRSTAMRNCLRPSVRIYPMGADVLWDLDLHEMCATSND